MCHLSFTESGEHSVKFEPAGQMGLRGVANYFYIKTNHLMEVRTKRQLTACGNDAACLVGFISWNNCLFINKVPRYIYYLTITHPSLTVLLIRNTSRAPPILFHHPQFAPSPTVVHKKVSYCNTRFHTTDIFCVLNNWSYRERYICIQSAVIYRYKPTCLHTLVPL